MAWTSPKTWVKRNLFTAALANLHIRDNLTVLRAGGIFMFGQVTNDFIAATTSTQFARVPAATGKIPWFDPILGWRMIVPAEAQYPVGIVYRAVVATNPNTLLGFGSWTQIGFQGRCTVGVDAGQAEFANATQQGGAKTHTLSVAELPSHTHTQDAHNHTQNAHDHTVSSIGNTALTSPPFSGSHPFASVVDNAGTESTSNTTATNQATTATNQDTGGGGVHQNLMPYICCYIWTRTA